MAHDDQFTAMGPPFAGSGFQQSGFSTIEDGDGFQFGVRVNAARCGVVGQSKGIAGVLGQGRFSQFGVMGTGFGLQIGVVGVSVANTNDLFNLNVPPGDFRLDSLGAGRGTGVLGKSNDGFGVHGITVNNDGVRGESQRGLGVHGQSVETTGVFGESNSGFGGHGKSGSNTGVFGESDTGLGVHGHSRSTTGVFGDSESGFGVHGKSGPNPGVVGESATGIGVAGSSTDGPGGTFESQHGAQIRLIPKNLASPEGQISGTGGELVVTTNTGQSGQTFGLWFCTRGGDAAKAVWQLVAGSRPFPGTLIKLNSKGIHVKRIQLQLNLVAAAGLVIDGDFGPLTRQAVVDFQTAQHIKVDGIVGPITWEKLFAVV